MYKDEIEKYSLLTIDDIIDSAKKILPEPYSFRPWSHPELKRGVALLESEDGLNSYLAAYGLAHKLKVIKALNSLPFPELDQTIEVFDWGCGQGLASVCLIQEFSKRNILEKVKQITLIEPSKPALERAILNVNLASDSIIRINSINQGLPPTIELPFECIDSIQVKQPIAIHLFSNILDIQTIELKRLAEILSSSGLKHYVLCVGPAYRNEDRINAFCLNFNDNKAKYIEFDNRTDEELSNPYSVPRIYPYYHNPEFFTDKSYTKHNFGCFIRSFKFDLSSGEPVLIPYKFYAPKQFFAGFKSDVLEEISGSNVSKEDCAFEILAPFDIGANVYDDIHPILAALNNIVVRGLPTKVSPYIEQKLAELYPSLHLDEEAMEYGTITYTGETGCKAPIDGEASYLIKNVPLAVARIEKTIIEAVLTCHISIEEDSWRVLVKESDVPCAALAFEELAQMFNHLCAASKDYDHLKFPEVELIIINSKYQSSELHLGKDVYVASNKLITEQEYDMVIDFSIEEKSRPLDVEFSEFKAKNQCYFNVRSSEVIYSERYIYTTDRIVYKPLTILNTRGTHDLIEENVEHLRYFVQLLFRKQDFREGQLPIISRALQLKSVIGLLPTGGGKSLTYQISAMLQPGVTIIVDPLMSLMKDQYDGLLKNGIDFCIYINSKVENKAYRESLMKDSKMLFVFLSPERLSIFRFRESLRAMADNHVYFAYGIIDEVHCVSEWGHDFRFSYLHLGRNLYTYVLPKQTDHEELNHITLVGLTATASFDVLADVERELSGNNAFPLGPEATVRYENTNRLELQYRIVKVDDESLGNQLEVYIAKNKVVPSILSTICYESFQELLKPEHINEIKKRFIQRENIPEDSELAKDILNCKLSIELNKKWYADSSDKAAAIVFCPHRKGFLGVHTSNGVGAQIRKSLGIQHVSEFVGGDDPTPQDDFIKGKTNIMVATKAFGMGIDKPHVRFTLNINHSGSLEAFVQEAGRAGRDKKMALSLVLFSDRVFNVQNDFTRLYEQVPVDYGVHKYFYDGNFLGVETEVMIMDYLMKNQKTSIGVDEIGVREDKSVTGFIQRLMEIKEGDAIISYISYKYPSSDSEALDTFLRNSKLKTIEKRPKSPRDNLDELFKINMEQYQASLMKAIYRMCCIGLIEDFTQDYSTSEFRIVTRKKPDGAYYEGLKQFFLRYYNEERASAKIADCRKYSGTEIENCLYFLTQFIYSNIATKRKQAIKDIEQFCKDAVSSDKDWLEVNEDLKDFLYYYFNSKYARSGYISEDGKPCSLVDDTNSGKDFYNTNIEIDPSIGSEFQYSIIAKYMNAIMSDGISSPKDNIKHLQGAVRLIRRGILSTNPALSLLNVFCILFLKADEQSSSMNEEFESSYIDGYLALRKSLSNDKFQSFISDYIKEIKRLNITDSHHIERFEVLGLIAEVLSHSEWTHNFHNKFIS
ncbi:MAG: ATP-dependent DNA helicase RecQ [Bacteroidales bacterium]|nr:ATP-dependent DNA helicase RecQ [Bacteroidales bacterium]